jgi:hypothetical protein
MTVPFVVRRAAATIAASLIVAAVAACAPARASGGGARPSASTPLDTLTMRRVARALSHDSLLGRKTGTVGGAMAARLIADECRALGLGTVGSESYFQRVPLVESTIVDEGTRIRVVGPGVDTLFFHHEEFIVDVGTRATLRDFSGDLVYVGRAPDILFRRSDLPDLRGKVALMRGELGAAMAAADTLRERGAIGVIQVVDDARRYRLFRQTRGPARLAVDDAAVASSFIPPLPAILAGPRMTVTLYEGLTGVTHGSWNDAYLNGLAAGLPQPRPLDGWRVEVSVRTTARRLAADNVACQVPGTDPSAPAVLLTAHHDHLGVGIPDLQGDSIYNGFSDNATGVAMVLAVGEWFARERLAGRGLRHTLVLLFPTGEEQGLLGADWFATYPPWPLARIAGVLNLDANAPAGRPTAWRIAGDDEGALVRLVADEAERQGWQVALAPPAPGSDYYPFLRRGVPAVFYVPTDGPYEGMSVTLSDSLRSAMWIRYHQPSDHYEEGFPFAGLARYAAFTRDVVRRLDTGDAAFAAARYGRGGSSFTDPGGSR